MKKLRIGRSRERAIESQVSELRQELQALKTEMVRLDADLDESRRLNLRAAELLDIVYEELGKQRVQN